MKYIVKPHNRKLAFDSDRLFRYLESITSPYTELNTHTLFDAVMQRLTFDEVSAEYVTQTIIKTALDFISIEEPNWTFVASRAYCTYLYKKAAVNRGYKSYPEQPYGSFYALVHQFVDRGIYDAKLTEFYKREEIEELGKVIDASRDYLFTYPGLYTLADRYLTTDFDGRLWELPQERFMIIAMYLMIPEANTNSDHIALVKEAYWALSHLYMTVATPTLANAGKAKGGQLSSCFIETIDDSLRSIYDTNTWLAMLSKMGGGIGAYVGKIRARGSKIRGFAGKAHGIVPWIRQLNNTAVSVDQLGTRKGSIAVYLDVWHKDILAFLDLRLNNGDERLRAHDIFPGVSIPDLFMEKVRAREEWHLFDPHEVKEVMGFSLEDSYDEMPGQGTFRTRYEQCVENPALSRITVAAKDVMVRVMKSQLETGTPYMFYRDTANRLNPNAKSGMIYCSNLCTEIMQNMKATELTQEYLTTEDGEAVIVTKRKPGDFVVCNLSSVHLGRAVKYDVLERLIPIQVRMLDNVIDLNQIDVLQAQYTNQRYRSVGLGTFGLHHLLALKKISWESPEAITYNDHLYEYIAYLTIRSSMELAKEKGAYPLFSSSQWADGSYFDQRGYTEDHDGKVSADKWRSLKAQVMESGIRNGYLMAVAPNGSTAIIAGSTASIDPIYRMLTYEEKNSYKVANIAPDLNNETIQYYRKHAFLLNQHASIAMAAARQRHIDQGQSFNLYIQPDIKAKDFLDLHLGAWENGLKATYYVRSQALSIEECESCQS